MNYNELLKKNMEVVPQIYDQTYGRLVGEKFRAKYSQDNVEAIINNYLLDPENEKYKAEFTAMQEYRKLCKEQAKEELK